MKLATQYTKQFKKDFELCIKHGYNMQLIKDVMVVLEEGESLPLKNKDHPLQGNYLNYRECHIQSDWLLIYQTNTETIVFVRTGTHSELF